MLPLAQAATGSIVAAMSGVRNAAVGAEALTRLLEIALTRPEMLAPACWARVSWRGRPPCSTSAATPRTLTSLSLVAASAPLDRAGDQPVQPDRQHWECWAVEEALEAEPRPRSEAAQARATPPPVLGSPAGHLDNLRQRLADRLSRPAVRPACDAPERLGEAGIGCKPRSGSSKAAGSTARNVYADRGLPLGCGRDGRGPGGEGRLQAALREAEAEAELEAATGRSAVNAAASKMTRAKEALKASRNAPTSDGAGSQGREARRERPTSGR